jgi:cyanophycinase
MSTHLVGGGWNVDAQPVAYGSFLAEAAVVAGRDGRQLPVIACVVLDEGDGAEQFARWESALHHAAPCRTVPVLVELGGRLDPSVLGDADGLLVCGGLTPAYAAALEPVAPEIRAWLRTGDRPYAGFSAGSAIASATAVVGGWLADGVPICSDDAAEDLDEVTVRPGLGLAPWTVDVHCAQWGTLTRLIETVRTDPALVGAGIDEDTVLIIGADDAEVRGLGSVWLVRSAEARGSVEVTPYRSGERVALP